MSAPKLRKLMTIDELCEILNCTRAYIYQRTGPMSKSKPRIPTVAGMKLLRFDPLEIERVFFSPQHTRSLTNKQAFRFSIKSHLIPVILSKKNNFVRKMSEKINQFMPPKFVCFQ